MRIELERRFYVGIDPGKKGAVSIMDTRKKTVEIIDMPLGPNKKEIEVDDLCCYLEDIDPFDCFFAIEKAQAMPRQGVSSVFNYAKGYGKILGALEVLGLPYAEIRPQAWKKEFSLMKKTKKDSVQTAIKLFPEYKEKFYSKRGALKDGCAESLLIAEFARRKNL